MAAERILVVEDDGIVGRDLHASLQRLGYNPLDPVASGEAAVAAVARDKPDLVLMDIHLGNGMDGIEAADRIRRRFDVPTIFLTAFTDEATVHRANTTAPLGYIHKPFDDNELHAAVETGLSRRRIERQLAEGRRWFETTLNCIGDGVIAADARGRVTFMNPPAELFTGWARGDAIGRQLKEILIAIDESTGQPVECPGLQTLREGVPADEDSIDMMIVARDGVRKPVGITASPIRSGDDPLDGIVVVLRDITNRRFMERQMVSQHKMDAVGKLSNSIAHEFGNILGIVTSYASALVESLTPRTRPHEDAARILEAARHGTDITRRILHIARASDVAGSPQLKPTPLSHVLRTTANLVEEPFSCRSIEVVLSREESMPAIMADPEHMVDVMMDLLLNAAEWMPKGGTIRIDVSDRTIAKPNRRMNPKARSGHYAVIRVRDNGEGIPPEIMEQVFEPFFMPSKTSGISLGLSVVNSAILRYGGWITVKSRPKSGTTFHLYLPAAIGERPSDDGTAENRRLSILLIDDDAEELKHAEGLLAAEGHRVRPCSTAAEGTAWLKKHAGDIDLCIADAIMPDTDIAALLNSLSTIRSDGSLIVTCGFSRDYIRRFLPHGAWTFLQKPFDRDLLLTAVRRAAGQADPAPSDHDSGAC